ncbi:hypothetical protein ACWC9R_22915 [Streptomyces sp. NPDC001219]
MGQRPRRGGVLGGLLSALVNPPLQATAAPPGQVPAAVGSGLVMVVGDTACARLECLAEAGNGQSPHTGRWS